MSQPHDTLTKSSEKVQEMRGFVVEQSKRQFIVPARQAPTRAAQLESMKTGHFTEPSGRQQRPSPYRRAGELKIVDDRKREPFQSCLGGQRRTLGKGQAHRLLEQDMLSHIEQSIGYLEVISRGNAHGASLNFVHPDPVEVVTPMW
jgi:hypothetical protein